MSSCFDPRRRVGVCPNLNFDRTRRVNGFVREWLRFKPNVSAQVVIVVVVVVIVVVIIVVVEE